MRSEILHKKAGENLSRFMVTKTALVKAFSCWLEFELIESVELFLAS